MIEPGSDAENWARTRIVVNEDTEFLTIAQAAVLMGTTKRAVYRWRDAELISFYQIPNVKGTRVKRSELLALPEVVIRQQSDFPNLRQTAQS